MFGVPRLFVNPRIRGRARCHEGLLAPVFFEFRVVVGFRVVGVRQLPKEPNMA